MSSGKGEITNEMITRFDSLNIAPENDVFFCLITFTRPIEIVSFRVKIIMPQKIIPSNEA